MTNAVVELLRESVLIQSAITLLIVGSAVYLFITNQNVPPDLLGAFWLVIGFFFGAKVTQALFTTPPARG